MPADVHGDEIGARSLKDIMGARYGLLTVVAEAERYCPPSGGSYRRWECECDCGTTTVVRQSDLRAGQQVSCGCRKREFADVIRYRSAHQRVDRVRGLASNHPCVDCGATAREWSYRHDDPNELYETRERDGRVVAYSLNPDAYEPRCRSCHGKFDKRYDVMDRDPAMAPFNVPCPYCLAGIGFACRQEGTGKTRRSHSGRRKAAAELPHRTPDDDCECLGYPGSMCGCWRKRKDEP